MKLYKTNVSLLEVRTEPNKKSNTFLKRDTVVEATEKSRQHKKEAWVEIFTVSGPKVVGYIQRKYLKEL